MITKGNVMGLQQGASEEQQRKMTEITAQTKQLAEATRCYGRALHEHARSLKRAQQELTELEVR